MSTLICPICEARFEIALSTAMPFCSARCRSVDLGRWFNEDYGVPGDPDPDAEDFAEEGHHSDLDRS